MLLSFALQFILVSFYLLIRGTLYDKLIQVIVNRSTFSNDADVQISSEEVFMQRTCIGK